MGKTTPVGKDPLVVDITVNRRVFPDIDIAIAGHRVVENRITEGDTYADEVIEAMVYQIAKAIGGAFVGVNCQAEAIVVTGGLANSKKIVKSLRKYAGRLAPVYIIRESLENQALARGVLEVLNGTKQANVYKKQ